MKLWSTEREYLCKFGWRVSKRVWSGNFALCPRINALFLALFLNRRIQKPAQSRYEGRHSQLRNPPLWKCERKYGGRGQCSSRSHTNSVISVLGVSCSVRSASVENSLKPSTATSTPPLSAEFTIGDESITLYAQREDNGKLR